MTAATHHPSRRAFLGIGAAVAAGAALASCAPPEDVDVAMPVPDSGDDYDGPPVTLKFWNGLTGGDGALMRDLLLEFRDVHPPITVEMFAMPWSSFAS